MIAGFIARESPAAAARVVERLLTSAASLQEFAERGRSVPEIEDPEIREILVLSFRLMYRVSEAQVTVLGVLHQRRDSGEWRLADLTDSSDAH